MTTLAGFNGAVVIIINKLNIKWLLSVPLIVVVHRHAQVVPIQHWEIH
jgi:hypothetical protein